MSQDLNSDQTMSINITALKIWMIENKMTKLKLEIDTIKQLLKQIYSSSLHQNENRIKPRCFMCYVELIKPTKPAIQNTGSEENAFCNECRTIMSKKSIYDGFERCLQLYQNCLQ